MFWPLLSMYWLPTDPELKGVWPTAVRVTVSPTAASPPTLPVIATPAGRVATQLPDDELPIGLLHLGDARQEQRVPDRAPVEEIAIFLD